jgi:Tfp pilus assembly protein PilN
MTTPSPSTPTPRRRWLQFSLRTLMMLVLMFGVGFGWLGMMLTRLLQHQHQADELRNHCRLLNRRIATTKAVTLETGPVQLDHLRALTGLQGPDFRRVRVTDAGVAELQKALPNCRIER